MAPMQDLLKYFKACGVQFEIINTEVPDKRTIAESFLDSTNSAFVKTLIVKADNRYWMAVFPSDHQISTTLIGKALDNDGFQHASDEEFRQLFPECEPSTISPFGNLHALPVILDESVTTKREFVFSICDKPEAIRMLFNDYYRLVRPRVGKISESIAIAARVQ